MYFKVYVYFKKFMHVFINRCFLQVEVDSGKELTEEFLQDELHPKKSLNTAKFSRPAPPSRGGNRRMIKVPPSATPTSS